MTNKETRKGALSCCSIAFNLLYDLKRDHQTELKLLLNAFRAESVEDLKDCNIKKEGFKIEESIKALDQMLDKLNEVLNQLESAELWGC